MQNVSDLVQLPGSAYSDPEFSFFETIAITGLAFLANSALDANYRDALLVGDNNNGYLYLFRLNLSRTGFLLAGVELGDLVADNTTEQDMVRFGQGFGAITDIQVGPNGPVYVTSISDGTVYRLPEPSATVMTLVGSLAVALGRPRRTPIRPS